MSSNGKKRPDERRDDACQLCTAIPANPECDSLNLAQAVQVTAYQAQQTLRGRALDAHASRFEGEAPASVEAIEGLYEHLEEAMIACGALNPERPKLMMPKLKKNFVCSGLRPMSICLGYPALRLFVRGAERSGRKSKKDGQQ